MRRLPVTLVPLAVALLAAGVRAGGARILDSGLGFPSYPDPQAAINAAPEGAAILVGTGNYGYLNISGKSVSLYAMPGATVNVPNVLVQNLALSQSVVLSGIHTDPGYNGSALIVTNCTGWVRCESCSFHALDWDIGACDWNGDVIHPGSPGVVVVASPRVVFHACTLTGGKGESTYGDSWLGACVCEEPDSNGGEGLRAQGSTSRVALYDCTLTGGEGGSAEGCQGYGGAGLWLEDGAAFLSGCVLQGGQGGSDFHQPPSCGVDGGSGGRVGFGLVVRVLDTSVTAGLHGYPTCGGSSAPWLGEPTFLAGHTASATFPSVVTSDQRNLHLAYQGGRFDEVLLTYGLETPSRLAITGRGPVLVKRLPLLPLLPLGTADAGGALSADVAMPDVTGGSGSLEMFVQVLSSGNYGLTPGSSAKVCILDRDSGPDCDGNGLNDFVQILESPGQDANHNLIPDGCPGG